MASGKVVTVFASQVGLQIKRDVANSGKVIRRSTHRTAEAARNILARTAPVDLGQLKASLRVDRKVSGTELAEVKSDAPYAGIIERGARPHPVSRKAQEMLARWAMRKFGVPEKEAKGIAFLIARKIAREGQKPRWWFKSKLEDFEKILHAEIQRTISEGIGNK